MLASYKTWHPTRINFKFLMYFIYINDCSKTIHGKHKQMLLANDTD